MVWFIKSKWLCALLFVYFTNFMKILRNGHEVCDCEMRRASISLDGIRWKNYIQEQGSDLLYNLIISSKTIVNFAYLRLCVYSVTHNIFLWITTSWWGVLVATVPSRPSVRELIILCVFEYLKASTVCCSEFQWARSSWTGFALKVCVCLSLPCARTTSSLLY